MLGYVRNGLRPSSSESGFALVLALACMLSLAIAVTAVVAYTSSTVVSSDRSKNRVDAFAVAEAGMQDAYSVLSQASTTGNPADPTLLGCDVNGQNCNPLVFTGPSGGVARVTGVYSTPSNVPTWTITSTGTAGYAGGAGSKQQKTLTATVTLATASGTPNAAIWNYVFATAPQGSGCEVDVNGTNTAIDVPVYVTGDLCLSGTNSAVVENTANGGQPVSLTVLGKLVYTGTNATVGTTSQSITAASIGQGCATSIGGATHPCSPSTDNYHVRSSSTNPTPIAAPVADANTWWASANPGPKHPCQSGSTPQFDNDAATTQVPNDSLTNVDLTPSTSYTCKSSDGGVTGEISWNDSTNVLTVKGTIFIDGNAYIDQSVVYSGVATIYVDGVFNLNGTNTTVCGVSGCSFTSWNPNQNMLLVCALASSGNSINLNGTNNKWQGGFFTNTGSTINLTGTNNAIEGPMIGGRFTWATNTSLKPLPTITNLPPGAPLQPNVHLAPQALHYTSG